MSTEFSTSKIYRVSKSLDNPKIAGAKCWFKRFTSWFGLRRALVEIASGPCKGELWEVMPGYIVPDNS